MKDQEETPVTESNQIPERREGHSETASGFPHRNAVRWHQNCFITAQQLCPMAAATLLG